MAWNADEVDLVQFDAPFGKPRRLSERVPGQLAFRVMAVLLVFVSFGPQILRVFEL